MQTSDEDFLHYYLEELSYLRHMGERFARDYPKVAGRLELQPGTSPDPHVERLIESFAFLTGRIQRSLDQDFPEIANELLNVLYPHYLAPVPSMAIACFHPDRHAKLTTGFQIARGTQLFAPAEGGAVCRMQTCYPVTLWPIYISAVDTVSPENFEFLGNNSDVASVIRIRLKTFGDPFEDLAVDSLRFFFSIPEHFDLLHDDVERVAVVCEDNVPRYLDAGAVQKVGFDENGAVIPYPAQSHPAYRLITEYFTFPLKFQFADVAGLRGKARGKAVDLLFLRKRVPPRNTFLNRDSLTLGCTPIINLFRKTSEPIRVDHRRSEYRLVADNRKEKTTDIHSIVSVSGSANPDDHTRRYVPFYSMSHHSQESKQSAFWHARRVRMPRADLHGTDVMLSFRDFNFRRADPPEEVVFAHLLCTNRKLAREMSPGQRLQTDVAMPVGAINVVKKPTPQLAPPIGGQNLWRLVSHLSLGYLALGGGEESLQALHEILYLYCFSDQPSIRQRISGITELSRRQVVRRVAGSDWRGFARGTEVALGLDENQYVGTSALLFASVLNAFFGLQASVNSFTQLVVHRAGREGEWKWPPMVGARAVL